MKQLMSPQKMSQSYVSSSPVGPLTSVHPLLRRITVPATVLFMLVLYRRRVRTPISARAASRLPLVEAAPPLPEGASARSRPGGIVLACSTHPGASANCAARPPARARGPAARRRGAPRNGPALARPPAPRHRHAARPPSRRHPPLPQLALPGGAVGRLDVPRVGRVVVAAPRRSERVEDVAPPPPGPPPYPPPPPPPPPPPRPPPRLAPLAPLPPGAGVYT